MKEISVNETESNGVHNPPIDLISNYIYSLKLYIHIVSINSKINRQNITFITARLISVICKLTFSQFLTALIDTKYKLTPVDYCSQFELSKTLRFK